MPKTIALQTKHQLGRSLILVDRRGVAAPLGCTSILSGTLRSVSSRSNAQTSVCLALFALAAFTFTTLASVQETRLPTVTIRWNEAAVQGIRGAKMGTPMSARALAIVHTCMYDAWAAYDERAVGTQLGGALRRPPNERTEANKQRAISYAAYRALTDVLPADTESAYKPLMRELGYDPNDHSTDIETPAGIGWAKSQTYFNGTATPPSPVSAAN